MNGNMGGDEEGEMTFIGRNGSSVIDYTICNAEAWDEVYSMKIGSRTVSDHRPIEITLEKKIEKRNKAKEERREIEDWSEEGCEKYQQIERKKRTRRGIKGRMGRTSK